MGRHNFKPVEEEGEVYTCQNAQHWPPIHIVVHGTAEDVRENESNHIFQKVRVWEQVCGLLEMDMSKCRTCPYLMRNGRLVVSRSASPVRYIQKSRGFRDPHTKKKQ